MFGLSRFDRGSSDEKAPCHPPRNRFGPIRTLGNVRIAGGSSSPFAATHPRLGESHMERSGQDELPVVGPYWSKSGIHPEARKQDF